MLEVMATDMVTETAPAAEATAGVTTKELSWLGRSFMGFLQPSLEEISWLNFQETHKLCELSERWEWMEWAMLRWLGMLLAQGGVSVQDKVKGKARELEEEETMF